MYFGAKMGKFEIAGIKFRYIIVLKINFLDGYNA